jgi:hypothetical protein
MAELERELIFSIVLNLAVTSKKPCKLFGWMVLMTVLFVAFAHLQISQYFGDEDLSKEPIHILVEVPALVSVVPVFSIQC